MSEGRRFGSESLTTVQAESGVRLEYEIWSTGSIWNLEWLIEHASLEPPYFTSLFFGWPGGA